MLSLLQAARSRGEGGEQIPCPFYPSLEAAGIRFFRSQLCLVVGPGSAGKSLLIANLVSKWDRSCLAFLLDQDKATAAARFAATVMDEPMLDLKSELDATRVTDTLGSLRNLQCDFSAQDMDDIRLQLECYIERFGSPPEILVVDNLGNMASMMDDQWSVLKAMTLELDELAREYEMLVICAAHTKDSPTTEPRPRSDILGQLHQYPRLILSVAFNALDGAYKLAAVKNSSGITDSAATKPLCFDAFPANGQIKERSGPLINQAADTMTRYRANINGETQ